MKFGKVLPSVEVYFDADWGENISDRKSRTGYINMMGNSPVMWSSRKQHSISLSSIEAEFIALSGACKEGVVCD